MPKTINAKSAPRTAIFTGLWPQRVTVLAMGCDAYGDAAMFGEGAVAKPPPEELEANDEVGKLRAYYGALKVGKTLGCTGEDSIFLKIE